MGETLPEGTVLDGEIVVWRDDRVQPFAELQKRIGRKTLSPKLLREIPVVLLAYDLLEWEGRDLRALPQQERRALLDALLADAQHPSLIASPMLHGEGWDDLARQREAARSMGVEGMMLKQRSAQYGVGRTKDVGVWWKWKIDPLSVDAVLVYAQRGHGRRASLYSDYTFAVWDGPPEARGSQARALRQSLLGPDRRRDGARRCGDPQDDGRKLRSGPQRAADAGVRARLRRDRAKHAAQERHRGALSAHAALAGGQAGGGSRHLADARCAAAVMSTMKRALDDWFAARGWKPFKFQREVWKAIADGRSGLLHATTGAGKTYAVWLGALLAFAGTTRGRTSPPLTVLWLTPMRALAADTLRALQDALDGVGADLHAWSAGARSGDTGATERSAQNRRLPTVLVTTPESLSLLLSRADANEVLGTLRMVVVDEWHELLGNKRGVQVQLALARLRRWNKGLRVWGMSATLGNLEEAMRTLLGDEPRRAGARRSAKDAGHRLVAARVAPSASRGAGTSG